MTIALLRVGLRPPSRTLKEKRTIVKSVVERLRNRFNASVAEVDDLDSAGLATIAAVVVSNESRHADEQVAPRCRSPPGRNRTHRRLKLFGPVRTLLVYRWAVPFPPRRRNLSCAPGPGPADLSPG